MKTMHACLANENGSALLVAVLMVPVLTLLCVFASNIGIQNTMVSVSEECRRDAFYDADAGLYGTAKLIALHKRALEEDDPTGIQAGENNEGPGIEYTNSHSDQALGFQTDVVVSQVASVSTTEDVKFVVPAFYATPNDPVFIESVVDIFRRPTGYSVEGSGAEFSTGADGAAAALTKVAHVISSQTQGPCVNTPVGIQGEFHWIVQKVSKGI